MSLRISRSNTLAGRTFGARAAALSVVTSLVTAAIPFGALADASSAAKPVGAPSEADRALATDFFDKGVKDLELGHCDETTIVDVEACKRARENFKRAYALYPSALGALRNLAYTEKGLGLVASAARDFRDLARKAPLDPKPERRLWVSFARTEAEALALRVPHLRLAIADAKIKGLRISLDGVDLPADVWNATIDIDPGPRKIHAEAPGYVPFDASVSLKEQEEKSLTITLTVDPKAMEAMKGPSHLGPYLVGGAGIVAVGVGLGFGYLALKKKNDNCDANKVCDPQAISDGKNLANVSTVVTSVGGAMVVGGLTWLLLQRRGGAAPTSDRATVVVPYASADGFGIAAAGAF
jgi:hypothetical protein